MEKIKYFEQDEKFMDWMRYWTRRGLDAFSEVLEQSRKIPKNNLQIFRTVREYLSQKVAKNAWQKKFGEITFKQIELIIGLLKCWQVG